VARLLTTPSFLQFCQRWPRRNAQRCVRLRLCSPPDPLLDIQDDDLSVRVSFIVGSDGNVHSAYVLDSGGPDIDQIVLRAIRFWRYRPALCNGVPTDSEALVRFSLH